MENKPQNVEPRSAWLWLQEGLTMVKSVAPAVITVVSIVVIGYLLVEYLGGMLLGE